MSPAQQSWIEFAAAVVVIALTGTVVVARLRVAVRAEVEVALKAIGVLSAKQVEEAINNRAALDQLDKHLDAQDDAVSQVHGDAQIDGVALREHVTQQTALVLDALAPTAKTTPARTTRTARSSSAKLAAVPAEGKPEPKPAPKTSTRKR